MNVRIVWMGVKSPEEFVERAREMRSRRGQRGARRRYVAWEITTHPKDANGAKRAFSDQDEMLYVAFEIVRQMHAKIVLIGLHGLRDLHILILNQGPTGLALKSYLPNRSNPRRVLVAVADRLERELNAERLLKNAMPLVGMEEIRRAEQARLKRKPLVESLLSKLSPEKEPDVFALLEAFRFCGWVATAKRNRLTVSFGSNQQARRYELDLVLRGVLRAWWARSRELEVDMKKKEDAEKRRELELCKDTAEDRRRLGTGIGEVAPPDFEVLTAAVHRWFLTGSIDDGHRQWLGVDDHGELRVSPTLRAMAEKALSPEANELLCALSAAQELIDEAREKDEPTKEPERS
jgi:hypothetical protein